jgi:hypothetical protein
MINNGNLLALPAMARRLRVTQTWLRHEARAGRIPALDAGGRLLFNCVAVERVLADRAAKPQRRLATQPQEAAP